jgi:hypothetical protein
MQFSSLRMQDRLAWAAVLTLLISQVAFAQQQVAEATAVSTEAAAVAAETPIEPKPAPDAALPQTVDKRILGVLPNYRTADGTAPFKPISAKVKLTIAAKDSFDWPNYIIGGVFAGLYQLEAQHPDFGQGVAGYGRYYGTSYADQVIGNMLSEGFMPILLHEDPRYFRKGQGSKWGRAGYALTRVLICKTDAGNRTFNFAEVLGNGMGASISNLYYTDDRGFSNTMTRMSTQIATDALSNVLKEFWPDIKRHLHRKRSEAQAFIQSR